MSSIVVAGDVSGAISIAAPSAAGSGVLTLPTGTDTLVGKATTDTLTNKTLVAPALGTPASGVLTNCTGVPAAALPAGSVLQVVQGSTTTQTTTAAGPADTTLTASITPRSASNKILVITMQASYIFGGGADSGASFTLLRGASVVYTGNDFSFYIANPTVGSELASNFNITYLDSPATTSSVTYKTQFKAPNGGTVMTQQSSIASTITLMEIAG